MIGIDHDDVVLGCEGVGAVGLFAVSEAGEPVQRLDRGIGERKRKHVMLRVEVGKGSI